MPRVTEATRSEPLGDAIANALSFPLVALICEAMSSQVIGVAVAPGRFRVDGVGDHLRVGLGQLDVGEVVGVDLHGAVGAMT